MEYKILKIAKIYGGSTPSTKSSIFWKQEIPFITPNFLTKNYYNFIYYSDRYITDLNYNYAYKNDIFITCRAPVGIVKINKLDKCYFSQGIKRIVPNKKIVKHKFLFYWFIKNKKVLLKYSNGSTYLEISKYNLEQIKINLPELIVQQHIIDIIEPFEKLAEIYEKLIKLINNLFSLITKIYSLQTKEKLLSYFNFIKGTEISSSKRTKNIENKLVKYIRVGDLTFNSERQSLYCTKDNNFFCNYQDILLATDGDPGRIMTGLNGVFSSSIRKVVPKNANQHSSIALLNLLNPINKEIFNAYTTGTTIKHGGNNAIKNLKYFEYDKHIKILVKSLYENLTTLQNNLTKVIFIKKLLINKLIE